MELRFFFLGFVFPASTLALLRIEPRRSGTLSEGDQLSLSCIKEEPSVVVDWFKGNEQITHDRNSLKPSEYNLTHSSTERHGLQEYVLNVQHVTKYNDGVYKCKAKKNGRYLRTDRYRLTVLYIPLLKYPLCNTSISISNKIAICESEIGNPEIILHWRHQSTDLHSLLDIESQTRKIDDFMHRETVNFQSVPFPLDLEDSIVCVLHTEPARNCSIPLRDIYNSFDPPIISSNTTISATENATISCSTNLTLANYELVFQYETFPNNRSLAAVRINTSITFTAIPAGIEHIHVSCHLKWGPFVSLTSDWTVINVIQPTTTPNPLDPPITTSLTSTLPIITPSLSSQTQLTSSDPPTKSPYTIRYDLRFRNTISDIRTNDHQNQVSTHTNLLSSKVSVAPSSSFRTRRTEDALSSVHGTLPSSTEMQKPSTDLLASDYLTTIQKLEEIATSKADVTEASNFSNQGNKPSTVLVSTELTKTTFQSTPPFNDDTDTRENIVKDFSSTNVFTTAHDSMTKAETRRVSDHFSTPVYAFPSAASPHPLVPSDVSTVISTSSKTTLGATSLHYETTSRRDLSTTQEVFLSSSTKKTSSLQPRSKNPVDIQFPLTKIHANDQQNGKGAGESGQNDDEDISVLYIVIACCAGTIIFMIGIHIVRKKSQSSEYNLPT